MLRVISLALLMFLVGCVEKDWTEGVSIGGFKRGLSTEVRYNEGGKTTFEVHLESEIYKELQYPIKLVVYLNGIVCGSAEVNAPSKEIFNVVRCSNVLGKGLHKYKVVVIYNNDLGYLLDSDDIRFNSIVGSITYILEDR